MLKRVLDDMPLVTDTDLKLRRMRTGRVYVSHQDNLLPLEKRSDSVATEGKSTQRLRSEFLQRWCADADPMLDAKAMNDFIQKQRGLDRCIRGYVMHTLNLLWICYVS